MAYNSTKVVMEKITRSVSLVPRKLTLKAGIGEADFTGLTSDIYTEVDLAIPIGRRLAKLALDPAPVYLNKSQISDIIDMLSATVRDL